MLPWYLVLLDFKRPLLYFPVPLKMQHMHNLCILANASSLPCALHLFLYLPSLSLYLFLLLPTPLSFSPLRFRPCVIHGSSASHCRERAISGQERGYWKGEHLSPHHKYMFAHCRAGTCYTSTHPSSHLLLEAVILACSVLWQSAGITQNTTHIADISCGRSA